MKILSWLGAVGIGVFAGTWLFSRKSRRGSVRPPRSEALNINEASHQELVSFLGLDPETADRIVEHRPYPSKIDLLGRMVIPEEVYVAIKDRIAYKAL
jgi:DNA uptake protein ComE-like DNA-binding protein